MNDTGKIHTVQTPARRESDRIEQIAQVCHEANRAYCHTLGDLSQTFWEGAHDRQRRSAINNVQFHLRTLEAGKDPKPSAFHESWLAGKKSDGWKFGHVKDVSMKTHPCFVPYDELPAEQKLKDFIFCAIVKAFYVAANTPAVR